MSADLLFLLRARRAAVFSLMRPRAARVVPRLVETVMVGTARTTVAETVARPVRARRQEMSFMLRVGGAGRLVERRQSRDIYIETVSVTTVVLHHSPPAQSLCCVQV